jgi:ABC-2 type transport system permease protein
VIAIVRTEFTKAIRRGRTLAITVGLVALPALIVVAIHARRNRPERGDTGEGLFRLAHLTGLLVPAAVLEVMSGFLLIVIAAMFAGDSIAADANWGNLRYLLMRPVARVRLLLAKAFVAGTMIWACTFLVSVAALVGGIVLFGAHPLTVPGFAVGNIFGGFTLSTGTILFRLLVATAYVAFGYSALLAIGTLLSSVTDTPAGAIGSTIAVYIVSEILDGISQFGVLRYGLPTHYLSVWNAMFTQNTYPHDMITGVIVQVIYVAVFGTAAIVYFSRKDIRS